MASQKKAGRPLLPAKDKRSVVLRVMLTREESDRLDEIVAKLAAPDRAAAARMKLFA